jgi:hypothetical protein
MKFFKSILLILMSIAFAIAASLSIKSDSLDILPKLEIVLPPEEVYFSCGDDKFISQVLICDGREDCADGYDEENCELNTEDV